MSTTAQVSTEIIKQSGGLPYFDLLVFALGVTAITFIAIIFLLDLKEQKEPVLLPEKLR
jgi:hypothetical protein